MAGGGRLSASFLCADEAQAPEQSPGREALNLELPALRSQLESTVSPGGLIGVSLRMQTIHNLIGKAKNHTFPVIILGETVTGKELVTRCIHNSGPRKHSAFVAVDCSSLTPTLIESELFGYMRGAFTAADTNRKGPVEASDTVTLSLNEIGELPREMHAVTGLDRKCALIANLRGALYRTRVRADASGRRWLSNSRRDWKQYSRRDGHTPAGFDRTVHHCEGAERNQGRQDRCCPHIGDWQDHDLPQA